VSRPIAVFSSQPLPIGLCNLCVVYRTVSGKDVNLNSIFTFKWMGTQRSYKDTVDFLLISVMESAQN